MLAAKTRKSRQERVQVFKKIAQKVEVRKITGTMPCVNKKNMFGLARDYVVRCCAFFAGNSVLLRMRRCILGLKRNVWNLTLCAGTARFASITPRNTPCRALWGHPENM